MTLEATDADLLARWTSGDRKAGGALVDRHFRSVHRFFHNKVSSELDDLVQQTFLGCIEASGRYRADANFRTFVLGIARYQLYTHYRKLRKDRDVEPSTMSVIDLGTTPTGALARREDEALLLAALRSIPIDLQVVLELAYWEGLDGAAIAEIVEVPLNTAYSRLRRAKELVRARLHELAPMSAAARSDVALDDWAVGVGVEARA